MDRNIVALPTHQIGILQSRANRNLHELWENVVSTYDLTTPEWMVLGYVSDNTNDGGVKVGSIAEELDVQSTYATALLRRLESKGLVVARAGSNDRRVRLITATDKGARLVADIAKDIAAQVAVVTKDVPDAALKQYYEVLAALAR
jgi:DNA-binding MarR family transcriptional regulator